MYFVILYFFCIYIKRCYQGCLGVSTFSVIKIVWVYHPSPWIFLLHHLCLQNFYTQQGKSTKQGKSSKQGKFFKQGKSSKQGQLSKQGKSSKLNNPLI